MDDPSILVPWLIIHRKKLTLELRWLVLTSAKYHGLHGKPNKQHYRSWPWPISTLELFWKMVMKNEQPVWDLIYFFGWLKWIYVIYRFTYLFVYSLNMWHFEWAILYLQNPSSHTLWGVRGVKEFPKRPWHPSNSPEQWSVHPLLLGLCRGFNYTQL